MRLKVEGRRDDGYHLLSMLNCATKLCDELLLALDTGGQIRFSNEDLEISTLMPSFFSVENNLATRAARSFFDRFGLRYGLEICLTKNIPIGAGLGGGSSDAASVVKFLTKSLASEIQNRDKISESEYAGVISELLLELGADCPYLYSRGLAFVSGVGEQIQNLNGANIFGTECLLIVPPIAIPTKLIYDRYRQAVDLSFLARDDLFRNILGSSMTSEGLSTAQLAGFVENDLEQCVCRSFPLVGDILARLREIEPTICGLSGSGSALFVLPKISKSFDKAVHSQVLTVAQNHAATVIETQLFA